MSGRERPIFLLADSQVFFGKQAKGSFIEELGQQLDGPHPTAAYLGAANGDRPEFFELLLAALEPLSLAECWHVTAASGGRDNDRLSRADLVVIGGGDPGLGWSVMRKRGHDRILAARYRKGAVLVGISAGAQILSLRGWGDPDGRGDDDFDALGLVPLIVSVHESKEWGRLRQTVEYWDGDVEGIGIPAGGAVAYGPGKTLRPLRRPVLSLVRFESEVTESILVARATGDV